jgi:cytidylate kinase
MQRSGLKMTEGATNFAIAIDGPAGAGKSTVGERLAALLDAVYFDSGVLYRAVTLQAIRQQVSVDDDAGLANIAATLDVHVARPSQMDGRQCDVHVGGEDVTWAIRAPEVDRSVSEVSAHPRVRAALLEPQRRIGRSGRVVMVGRDIGTVVMPDAGLKIYLNASLEERAHRRFVQLLEAGKPARLEDVLAEMRRRDSIDSERSASPLRPANSAVIIDTDDRTIDQVVDEIAELARSRVLCRATPETIS